jgi:hypothetical protein
VWIGRAQRGAVVTVGARADRAGAVQATIELAQGITKR